ncbi:MAG: S8 family serine peptidase [Anaerolineae bacterium]|nr:S8 family serine peptidase [Anaerolineae bacterium]
MPKKLSYQWFILILSFVLSLGGPVSWFAVPVYSAEISPLDLKTSVSDPDNVSRVVVALRVPATQRGIWAQSLQIAQIQNQVLESVAEEDFVLIQRYQTVPGLVGMVTEAGLEQLRASPDVLAVAPDMPVQAATLESAELIRVPQARAAYGLTGRGVVVAVVDSGIDVNHPDLADHIVAQHCFAHGGCPPDGAQESDAAQDSNGHGTHVAGIITGRGTASPQGIAPDAEVVAIRVLDDQGQGWNSDVVAAIDWIVANQWRYNVRVINLSLGGGSYDGACDFADANTIVLANAIAAAHTAGMMTVAASGNGGQSARLMAPACLNDVVAVGSVYDTALGARAWGICSDAITAADQIACFSNSGAMLDLLAPGAWIESAALGGGQRGDAGTSLSAPHVAAAAAMLLQSRPDLTPDEIETTLKITGISITDPRNGYAVPRIDVMAAASYVISPSLPATPTPSPASVILSGTVLLQGRNDHSGTSVMLSDIDCQAYPTSASAGAPGAVTATDGRFTLSVPAGVVYRCLIIQHTRYLSGLQVFSESPGRVTLPAGDLTGDGLINIFDLTRVASQYGTNDSTADLNGDGIVNIFDLTIIGGNYGISGPVVWGQ